MLKLSTASFTFCWFLTGRFHKHFSAGNTSIKNFSMVILSVSYGLCQYSIAQSCNLMWLDGVYMLPLILLGVYHMVCEKQHGNWQFQWPCPFFSTGTPEVSTASSPGSGFSGTMPLCNIPAVFQKSIEKLSKVHIVLYIFHVFRCSVQLYSLSAYNICHAQFQPRTTGSLLP